jgi:hypothetical protein
MPLSDEALRKKFARATAHEAAMMIVNAGRRARNQPLLAADDDPGQEDDTKSKRRKVYDKNGKELGTVSEDDIDESACDDDTKPKPKPKSAIDRIFDD